MAVVADLIRELMTVQQLSVRKVSARIAEVHGGSAVGYTQQISRILNDPTYDPTLSTVQKIFSALNVSFWQTSTRTSLEKTNLPLVESPHLNQLESRLDQLTTDVADLRSIVVDVQQSVAAIAKALPLQTTPTESD